MTIGEIKRMLSTYPEDWDCIIVDATDGRLEHATKLYPKEVSKDARAPAVYLILTR